jgi:hypothetical protein
MDEMEMSDREHDGIRVRAVGAMVEETGTAPTGGRVLFEDCYEVPSPTPIEDMSPVALDSVMAKSPSSSRLGGDVYAATPTSPLATSDDPRLRSLLFVFSSGSEALRIFRGT